MISLPKISGNIYAVGKDLERTAIGKFEQSGQREISNRGVVQQNLFLRETTGPLPVFALTSTLCFWSFVKACVF